MNTKGSAQLSIFDELQPATQDKIVSTGVSSEFINQRGIGIKLSKGEHKLLLSISKLLDKKSQTTNRDADDYYIGNTDPNSYFKRGTGQQRDMREVNGQKTAAIAVTLYELTKEYKGGETISGKDVDNVSKLLKPLADDPEKRALLKYTRTTVDAKTGKRTVDAIETYQHLLSICWQERTVFDKENVQTSQNRQCVILLNPIFRDQIESKYVDYPDDIIKRINDANGSPNVSEVALRLIDLLAHARSNKNEKYAIYQKNLYLKLAEDQMRDPKRGIGYIRKHVDKAIEISHIVGLIKKFELVIGADGSPKYIFHISRDW